MLWALDDPRAGGLLALAYPYFETEGVPFSEPVSYVEHAGTLASPDIVHFNHECAAVTSIEHWLSLAHHRPEGIGPALPARHRRVQKPAGFQRAASGRQWFSTRRCLRAV